MINLFLLTNVRNSQFCKFYHMQYNSVWISQRTQLSAYCYLILMWILHKLEQLFNIVKHKGEPHLIWTQMHRYINRHQAEKNSLLHKFGR